MDASFSPLIEKAEHILRATGTHGDLETRGSAVETLSAHLEQIEQVLALRQTSFYSLREWIRGAAGSLRDAVDRLDSALIAAKTSAESSPAGGGIRQGDADAVDHIRMAQQLCESITRGVLNLWERTAESVESLGRLESEMSQCFESGRAMQEVSKNIVFLADEGASNVQEIVRSAQEMTMVVRTLEGRARDSSSMNARTTDTIARQGMMSVVNGAEGISKIEESVSGMTATIERLGERSADIDRILAVIREVTEQTRLLSLNAQILAAQAGEHGRGFSVVADEMQELSEKTGLSAHGISEVVCALRDEIRSVIKEAGQLESIVAEGSGLVMRIGSVLREILVNSQQSTAFSQDIQSAMTHQTEGLDRLLTSSQLIERMIHDVTRGVRSQETQVAALNTRMAEVARTVGAFRSGTDLQAGDMRSVLTQLDSARERHQTADQAIQNLRPVTSVSRGMREIEEIESNVRCIREVVNRWGSEVS